MLTHQTELFLCCPEREEQAGANIFRLEERAIAKPLRLSTMNREELRHRGLLETAAQPPQSNEPLKKTLAALRFVLSLTLNPVDLERCLTFPVAGSNTLARTVQVPLSSYNLPLTNWNTCLSTV